MFPPSMALQRDRLFGALGRIVSQVDQLDELVPYLQELGRDHRKFGAVAAHYPAVGASLLAALAHFSDDEDWTPELAADWAAAYDLVAQVMVDAANEGAKSMPAYWDGEIIDVDVRSLDIAVVTVRTQEPLPYQAGQSFYLELTNRRPRMWRCYTPANPPGDTELELHVRQVPGGPVSTALIRRAGRGDAVRLGPPLGQLTLEPTAQRPLLLIAGGTGLAPMKSIIGQLAADEATRPTELFHGCRTVEDVYDGPALAKLGDEFDWLNLTTVVSDDHTWDGRTGLVGEAAFDGGDRTGHDVYICGSPQMTAATVSMATEHGVPPHQIRYDAFSDS